MESSKDPERGDVVEGQPVYYGTLQEQPNFPQPVPPNQEQYHPAAHEGYLHSSVQGTDSRITEGRHLLGGEHYERGKKLPFCNLGWGWFLFILGFFLGIPWYIGAVSFYCLTYDYRERAGFMACTIAAAVLALLRLMVLVNRESGEDCRFCAPR